MDFKLNKVLTAYFRDGIRRIDLVIVVAEDGVKTRDKVRLQFFGSLLKLGLHLEVEPGVMNCHRDLIFVKVHAPNKVIDKYGAFYNIRKPFKHNHLHYLVPERNVLEILLPFIKRKDEGYWIKMVRNGYPDPVDFSTCERNLIVYKMMQTLPFGEPGNFYNLQKLLDNHIMNDAFALHDGPYFFTDTQCMCKVNARQLLDHSWFGPRSWYKAPPLHLIREYFGERIGFYFAFFSFYNMFLFFASMLGVINLLVGLVYGSHYAKFDYRKYFGCQYDANENVSFPIIVCPACRYFKICFPEAPKDVCHELSIIHIIDNDAAFLYSFFLMVFLFLFYALWRRRESFLSFLWEINTDAITLSHKEELNYKRPKCSFLSKCVSYMYGVTVRLFVVYVIVLGGLLIMIVLTLGMTYIRYQAMFGLVDYHPTATVREIKYAGTLAAALTNALVVIVSDTLLNKLIRMLTNHERDVSIEGYETSFISKIVPLKLIILFPMLIYFAFIKGAFFTHLLDMDRWKQFYGLGMEFCFPPYRCLGEVTLIFIVLVIVKMTIGRQGTIFWKFRTDYNEGKKRNTRVPIWEREFRLMPVRDQWLTDRYVHLLTILVLWSSFSLAFPVIPVVILAFNKMHLRQDARRLLLASRRPLLFSTHGTKPWINGLFPIMFVIVFFQAMMLAFPTNALRGYFFNTWPSKYDWRFYEHWIETRKEPPYPHPIYPQTFIKYEQFYKHDNSGTFLNDYNNYSYKFAPNDVRCHFPSGYAVPRHFSFPKDYPEFVVAKEIDENWDFSQPYGGPKGGYYDMTLNYNITTRFSLTWRFYYDSFILALLGFLIESVLILVFMTMLTIIPSESEDVLVAREVEARICDGYRHLPYMPDYSEVEYD